MNDRLRIAQLENQVERLKQENQRLRRELRNSSAHARRIQRSYEDALQLALAHVGYQTTSRMDSMENLGLTQRRWTLASAFLRMAGLHTGKAWRSDDLSVIESRLKVARQQAIDSPRAYRRGLPRYLQ